jgi:VanZ family protein
LAIHRPGCHQVERLLWGEIRKAPGRPRDRQVGAMGALMDHPCAGLPGCARRLQEPPRAAARPGLVPGGRAVPCWAAMRRMRRYGRWLPSLAWMLFLSYWSGQSSLPIDHTAVSKDLLHKLAHVGAYAVLAALNRWALAGAQRAALWAWVLAAAFGAVDEWHQAFTPGREAAVRDWLLDALAAAAAAPVADRVVRTSRGWRVRESAPTVSANRTYHAAGDQASHLADQAARAGGVPGHAAQEPE